MPSSQDSSAGIPFVHGPDCVGYRLLELPPALATSSSTESWSLASVDGQARLHTGGRTYALRQKNTSNALLLLRAGPVADPGNAGGDAASDAAVVPGLTAVATLHETVELLEEAAAGTTGSAAAPRPAATTARGKWHEKFGRTR
ncbi:Sister chromatid cohesion protein DCC1 [Niveomyces insectorum RCEF 264]|uniref:Sister chromatid cohesion protein DCC1 n=1 Tax=Niveomyces insectorum RCEF 264 TaxID=1081102 RepID=A0A167PVL2_9HYPO|nr:Sister chromatid cohesion protein DCC1 [Niveomyces insectorum RCEF 264]